MNDQSNDNATAVPAAPRTKAEKLTAIRQKNKDGLELTDAERALLAAKNAQVLASNTKTRREEKQDDSSRRPNCTTEISEKTARDILTTDRGLRNLRVIEVCLKLAEVAAKQNGLLYNRYLFTHGVQKAIEARKNKSSVLGDPIDAADVWLPGSRIRLNEEYALFDYGLAWQQIKGKAYSFEEFRELRRACITDVFRFGRDILGRDFHSQPHGRWASELFVQRNPDLLPEDYTMEDYKLAFAAQSDVRKRMLISSRSSYKSSYNLVDLLSWVLCFPSIRIMCLSSTKPLSRGFLKLFRSWWTIKNPAQMDLFSLLYPEFMLWPGEEGAETSFTSPMRRLDMAQPTFFPVSLDTEGLAGERCDYFVSEDCAEITNSSTPEQREKTQVKFDMLRELLEPFGMLQVVGTPIASGVGSVEDPGDIYSVMLAREKQNPGQLLCQVNPCWVVKDGVNKLPYDKSLTAGEVDLLFPSRLTFPWLMGKLRESEKQFRQQSLCSWVPDADAELQVSFEESELRARMKPKSFFDRCTRVGMRICSLDQGASVSQWADPSAIVTGEVLEVEGRPAVVIVDVINEKLKISALAIRIVETIRDQRPELFIVEKTGAHESLWEAISKAAMLRSISLPRFHWITCNPGGGTAQSKAERIKMLEARFANGQLYLYTASWSDVFIQQSCSTTARSPDTSRKTTSVTPPNAWSVWRCAVTRIARQNHPMRCVMQNVLNSRAAIKIGSTSVIQTPKS